MRDPTHPEISTADTIYVSEIRFGADELVICSHALLEPEQDTRLTAGEHEIALAASRGLSNMAIARQRGSSHRTVANQLATIYRKLNIGSRSQLVRLLL